MLADCYDDFLDAVYLSGGKSEFKLRIIASAALAIDKGDDWRDVLDSLRHNRPEMFCQREALKRQRKARYHHAD